jgi:mannose-6-phosphate isomerase
MILREPLRFEPLYQERVWGGRALDAVFGRSLPAHRPIGESWEIVDRTEAQSVARGGPVNGWTLRRILAEHGAVVMGPHWPKDRPFPLLVKWLDCRERLSLQVHPPADLARELHGEPKTENWYIAHSALDAKLIVGLRRGVTRAQFERAIADGTVEACVHHFPVAAGDSILVHSGEVHAIDAGNLILEIQQNSDTTYRLYDWGRVGLDGKARKLHVEESLRSILWNEEAPQLVRAAPTSGTIASCDEFTIRRMVIGKGESIRFAAGEQPRILSVAAGGVSIAGANPAKSLAMGDNALLPWSAELEIVAPEPSIVLVTEGFA